MQRNNGDMIVLSSTYIGFESSASTMYFQYIHLPVCQLPVHVYWVRNLSGIILQVSLFFKNSVDLDQLASDKAS